MIVNANALHIPLVNKCVHTIVTSPPYYGLRDYGTATWQGGDAGCDHKGEPMRTKAHINANTGTGNDVKNTESFQPYKDVCGKCGAIRIDAQIGLEPTPEEYIANLVSVFRECKRVLRDDGTLWVNIADSYSSFKDCKSVPDTLRVGGQSEAANVLSKGNSPTRNTKVMRACGLKNKDLIGIPWMLAFALRADGWCLRSEIIWAKPNPMPESVKDRPTKSHEQIFLFSKAKWMGAERGRYAHISDEDARWLAMFFDTEGNISVKRAEMESGRTTYGTQIAFANTNLALLEAAKRIIGDGTIHERGGKNAPMFYYQIANKMARDLLYRIYPFLIVKQRQGALGIHLQDVLSTNHKRPGGYRSQEHTDWLEWAWNTMKSLNHFGNPDLSKIPIPKYGHWDSQKYYYDSEAIKEPAKNDSGWAKQAEKGSRHQHHKPGKVYLDNREECQYGLLTAKITPDRNKRDVWTITTKPYKGAHFATFNPELIKPCILAGAPEGGIVFDPFVGSGTTVATAMQLGRKGIGLDLSMKYLHENATARIDAARLPLMEMMEA